MDWTTYRYEIEIHVHQSNWPFPQVITHKIRANEEGRVIPETPILDAIRTLTNMACARGLKKKAIAAFVAGTVQGKTP